MAMMCRNVALRHAVAHHDMQGQFSSSQNTTQTPGAYLTMPRVMVFVLPPPSPRHQDLDFQPQGKFNTRQK
eukprot:2814121-Pyramimonas_sp.AAC.1